MKNLLNLSILAVSISIGQIAFAATTQTEIIYSDDAVLTFCGKNPAAGCYDAITIDGDAYPIVPIGASDKWIYLQGNHNFHQLKKSVPGKAVGFIVEEKGLLPNPTKTSKAFYALVLDFSAPRSIQPKE